MNTVKKMLSVACAVSVLASSFAVFVLHCAAQTCPRSETVIWANTAKNIGRVDANASYYDKQTVETEGGQFENANKITLKNAAAYYGRWGLPSVFSDSGTQGATVTEEMLATVKFSFWAKLESNADKESSEYFGFLFFNEAWQQLGLKYFSVSNSGEWQKIEFSLSDMSDFKNTGLSFIRLVNDERHSGTLKNGDSIYIADLQLVYTDENVPSKPEVESVEAHKIVLKDYEDIEYSINGGESWQKSNVFDDLESYTDYKVTARYTGREETSEYVTVSTPLAEGEKTKEKVIWQNTATVKDAIRGGVTNDLTEVSDNERFNTANAVGITDALKFSRFETQLHIYPDDLSTVVSLPPEQLSKMKLTFSVMLPAGGEGTEAFRLEIKNSSGEGGGSIGFEVSERGVWKDIELNLSDFGIKETDLYFFLLRNETWNSTTLKSGDTLYISPIKLTHKKKIVAAPDKPQLLSVTHDTISVLSAGNVEYSIDGGENWQTSNEFTDLSSNTVYSIVSRYIGKSGISEPLIVKTGIKPGRELRTVTVWENTATVTLPDGNDAYTSEFVSNNDPEIPCDNLIKVTITDSSKYSTWQNRISIKNDESSQVSLLSCYKEAVLSFYVKTDRDSASIVYIRDVWLGSGSYLITTAAGKWQRVEIPISSMTDLFDYSRFTGIEFADNNGACSNGDTIYFADIKITYEKECVIHPDPENSESILLWGSLMNTRLPEACEGVEHAFADVKDNTVKFTKCCESTFKNASLFNNNEIWYHFYPNKGSWTVDVKPYFDNMKVAFYIKLPEGRDNQKFRLTMGNGTWDKWAYQNFTVEKGGRWQKLEFWVSDMDVVGFENCVFNFMALRAVDGETSLHDGDIVSLADVRVTYEKETVNEKIYKDKLYEYTNPYTANAEEILKYDVNTAPITEKGVKGTETVHEKYGEYFSAANKIIPSGAGIGNDWGVYLDGDKPVDISGYNFDSVAVRAFVKVPKANTRIEIGLTDVSGKILKTTYRIPVANEWYEVQIRLGKLAFTEFDKENVRGFYLGSQFSEEFPGEFLEKGQTVSVGGLSLWSDSPVRLSNSNAKKFTFADVVLENELQVDMNNFGKYSWKRDRLNIINQKSTWSVVTKKTTADGFYVGIPLPDYFDLTGYTDFGYLSFFIAADKYTSLQMIISDSNGKTYSQEVSASQEGSEQRVYFHDMLVSGLDVSNIQDITISRDRKIGADCYFTFTEFSVFSDLYSCDYKWNSKAAQGSGSSVPENGGNFDYNDEENGERSEPESQPKTTKVIRRYKKIQRKRKTGETESGNAVYWIIGSAAAAVVIGGATAATVLLKKKHREKLK